MFVLEYKSQDSWQPLLQTLDKNYLDEQMNLYRSADLLGEYRIMEYEVVCRESRAVNN